MKPRPVEVMWHDDVSGKHVLRFAWDESIERFTATTLSGGAITIYSLSDREVRRLQTLLASKK